MTSLADKYIHNLQFGPDMLIINYIVTVSG